jgi:hypothetical protein
MPAGDCSPLSGPKGRPVGRGRPIRRVKPCHLHTNLAPQRTASLFDHLFGLNQQICRNSDAQCLCGLEIDH